MSSTWLKDLKKLFGQELLDFGQPNLIQCLSEGQVDKTIPLLLCNNSIFFFCSSLIYLLPLWRNNKLLYFWKNYVFQPVIRTIFWDHDTSHSVVFYEIILWRHIHVDHVSYFTCYRSGLLNERRKHRMTEKKILRIHL